MKNYLSNLLFYFLNLDKRLYIKREFVVGRGVAGKVIDFNYGSGKLILAVFDYGMVFPREYSKEQLEK